MTFNELIDIVSTSVFIQNPPYETAFCLRNKHLTPLKEGVS